MKCLSIRQPWAWLIIHGGKDIENRDWPTRARGRVLIHASKGMTRGEYDHATLTVWARNDALASRIPGPSEIQRSGIIGSVEIVDCVSASASPWFTGKFGFVLCNPIALPFRPLKGRLGFFDAPDLPEASNPRVDRAGASPAQVQRVVGCELTNGEKP